MRGKASLTPRSGLSLGPRSEAVGKGGRFKPKRGKAAAVAAREEPLGFPPPTAAPRQGQRAPEPGAEPLRRQDPRLLRPASRG